MTDPNVIEKLATLARKHGVREIEADGVRLVLGPIEAPLPKDAERGDEAPTCAGCKHPTYDHDAGICTHGCDIGKCAGPEVKP